MTRPPYAFPDPDRDYSNGAFIPQADSFPPKWNAAAASFRDSLGPRAQINLPYGPTDRHRFDLYRPEGPPKGVLVFIHGGYWMAFTHQTWSHFAAGPLARGWAVAMPSYTLAPHARIGTMTQEIATACRAIAALVPGPMVVTGHSAGGHLSARMGCADINVSVRRVVPISPLAELGPLLATKMNDTLHLDPAECATESPARHALRPGTSAHVWVGAQERPVFLQQARLLAEEWDCPWTAASDCHHFDVLDALTDPVSALVNTLLA